MSKKSIYQVVGDNIQLIRKERHFSQLELSLRSQVDRSYIAKLECGRVNPSIRVIYYLASALEVPLYYLVRNSAQRASQKTKLPKLKA